MASSARMAPLSQIAQPIIPVSANQSFSVQAAPPLVIELPFKIPRDYQYQPPRTIEAPQQQPVQRALQLLRASRPVCFTSDSVYGSSAGQIVKQLVQQQQPQQQQQTNLPQLLVPPPPQPVEQLVYQMTQVIQDVQTADPVSQACLIAQKSSLIGYTVSDNPQDDGLSRYLRTQDAYEHSATAELRACAQLISVLFCSPFYQQPKIRDLQTEQDHQLNHNDLEVQARKFSLTKWFEHYLIQKLQQMNDSQQIAISVCIGRYTQAARLLTANGLQKLALIVSSGQRVRERSKEQTKLDLNLIYSALEGNVEELIRQKLLGNWMELLAVLVFKQKSVGEALAEYQRLRQPETHYLFKIIQAYAGRQKITPGMIEDIAIQAPLAVGFLVSQVFVRFLQGDDYNRVAERIAVQLAAQTRSKQLLPFCSGEVWKPKIYGLNNKQVLAEAQRRLVEEYLGERRKKLDGAIEGGVECLGFVEDM